MADEPNPGVRREQRISDEGLMRLEKQFQSGVNISTAVLRQWVKRYGEPARALIKKYEKFSDELDR